jgi:hypothetical protein
VPEFSFLAYRSYVPLIHDDPREARACVTVRVVDATEGQARIRAAAAASSTLKMKIDPQALYVQMAVVVP